MKSNRFFLALCAAAALLSAFACKKEIEQPDGPKVKPEIKVTGVTTNITFEAEAEAKTFNVKGNYAWRIESDKDWLAIAPAEGEADQVVSVTVTPAINEARDAREAVITISMVEQEYSKTISVTQLGYDGAQKDTHEPGFVFFQDDFNWIAGIWPSKLANSKYGWTSIKVDGTNYNEFSLKNGYDDVDAVFDQKGYTYYDNNSTYCRYEGYIKLGRAAQVGYICTPALSQIDAESVASLAVTFDACLNVATNGNPSANQWIKLKIIGEGIFKSAGTEGFQIGEDSKVITIPLPREPLWKWVRKQVIVAEADKSTAIQFGVAEEIDARSLVDNIKIERCLENATPAADAVQPDAPLDKEIGTANEEKYPSAGAQGEFTVRVNRAWSASVDADWVTIKSGTAGKSTDGYSVTVATGGRSVDVAASCHPYNIKFDVAENKAEQERTATVTITADGSAVGTITIKQEAYVEPVKVDSHSAGYEFLNENFNWITAMYDTSKYSYWGWPTATTNAAGTTDQKITTFSNMVAKMAELGWTYDSGDTYVRYEGCIRMGRSAQRGSITTPALSGIDDLATATLDVAFSTAMYASAGNKIDTANVLLVSVIGPGSIVACGSPVAKIAGDGKTANITIENDLDHIFVLNRKHFIVADATSETSIKFGKGEAHNSTRYFLDDVVVSRVADGTTTAAADQIVVSPLSTGFSLKSNDPVSAEGGDIEAIFRANRAYTAASDADWLKIKEIKGGAEKGGVTIAEDKLSATVTATGLEYCNTLLTVAANTATTARQAHITITIAGETPIVLTVSQAGKNASDPVYGEPTILAKWTFTGLYETFTHSDGKTYEAESETTANMIKAWKNRQPVNSDVVAGGALTLYAQDSGTKCTGGTNTQAMNRMRFSAPTVGDYFLFTLSDVSLAANSKVSFLNGYITGTNASKSPGDWAEEYSLDGTNWVFVKNLQVGAANPNNADAATFMNCEFTIPEAVSGTLYFRVRISSDRTINSGTMTTSNRDIAYIGVDPAIQAASTFATRLPIYTDDKDYLVFSAKQIIN